MRDRLIDLLRNINTMSCAGLSTFAKIDQEAYDSQVREFIENWANDLEVELSKLRGLLDDD